MPHCIQRNREWEHQSKTRWKSSRKKSLSELVLKLKKIKRPTCFHWCSPCGVFNTGSKKDLWSLGFVHPSLILCWALTKGQWYCWNALDIIIISIFFFLPTVNIILVSFIRLDWHYFLYFCDLRCCWVTIKESCFARTIDHLQSFSFILTTHTSLKVPSASLSMLFWTLSSQSFTSFCWIASVATAQSARCTNAYNKLLICCTLLHMVLVR